MSFAEKMKKNKLMWVVLALMAALVLVGVAYSCRDAQPPPYAEPAVEAIEEAEELSETE